jgi:hypothetical protein
MHVMSRLEVLSMSKSSHRPMGTMRIARAFAACSLAGVASRRLSGDIEGAYRLLMLAALWRLESIASCRRLPT